MKTCKYALNACCLVVQADEILKNFGITCKNPNNMLK